MAEELHLENFIVVIFWLVTIWLILILYDLEKIRKELEKGESH